MISQTRLLDVKEPLAKRMRIVCSLRAVPGNGTVDALACCLKDESALLRHEVAYALGQKEDTSAIPILIDTLRNDCDAMVRHEAAEALGAIGSPEALKTLEEFESCDVEEVAHTCQLALDRIRWATKESDNPLPEGYKLCVEKNISAQYFRTQNSISIDHIIMENNNNNTFYSIRLIGGVKSRTNDQLLFYKCV